MKKVFAKLLALLLVEMLAFATIVDWSPAQAQFTDQRSYASSTGGSANAQTVAIANYALNAGVELRIVPSFTNNAATTFNVNATGAVTVLKQTTTGLAALTGGEIVAGQIVKLIYDGTRYQLTNPQNPAQRQASPTNSFYANANGSGTALCGDGHTQTCQPGLNVAGCGLSIAAPCQTAQFLIDSITGNYDFGNTSKNFFLAQGTYNECLVLAPYVYTGKNDKSISITGDWTNPVLTKITCASGNGFTASGINDNWVLQYIQIKAAAGDDVYADYCSQIAVRGVNLDTANNGLHGANTCSFIEPVTDTHGNLIRVIGNMSSFISVNDQAHVIFQNVATQVTDGTAFSFAFMSAAMGGTIDVSQAGAFGGSAITGAKYFVGQSFDNSSNSELGAIYCGGGVDCNSVLLGNVFGTAPQARYNQLQTASITLNTGGATATLTGSGTQTNASGSFVATGNVTASGGSLFGVNETLTGTLNAAGATLTGAFVGTSGAFSGAISAVGETFTGAMTGTSAVFSGALAAAAITGTNITASGYVASGSASPTGAYGSTAMVSPTGAAHKGINTTSARCAATSGTSSLANGFNCATLTTSGAGVYSVAFSNNLANADYQISLEPSAAFCTNTGTKTVSGFGFISFVCTTGTPTNFTGIMDIAVTGGN